MTYLSDLKVNYHNIFALFVILEGVIFLYSSASATTDEQFFDMEKLTISDDPVINTGWKVYQVKCAVCHGPEGLGNGPMEEVLIKKPADLTQISKRYGGDFPFWEIYEKIDGRNAPLEHGTSEMPVWGKEFAKEAAGISDETLIKGRIKALLTYLKSIQK